MVVAKDEKSATGSDVERPYSSDSSVEGEEIKRDLKSRHINMIAIAGMIVGFWIDDSTFARDRRFDTDNHREPVSF
jgi:amino acid permease